MKLSKQVLHSSKETWLSLSYLIFATSDYASEHVYYFTAASGGYRVFNAEVVDDTDRVAYCFVTEGKRMPVTMYDVAKGGSSGVFFGVLSGVTQLFLLSLSA